MKLHFFGTYFCTHFEFRAIGLLQLASLFELASLFAASCKRGSEYSRRVQDSEIFVCRSLATWQELENDSTLTVSIILLTA
jgi:hypothetical protein